MSTYARLDAQGVALEICDAAALATHEPTLAATFIVCPDGTLPGAVLVGGHWTAPPAASIAETALPVLTPMTLYMAFTPMERIAIKKSVDPMVVEFWAMYQLSVQLEKPTDPNLVSVQEALAYLAAPAAPGTGAGILASTARIAQISAGIPQ